MRSITGRRALVTVSLLALGCTAGTPASAGTPPSSDPYTASLAYARCLRHHGVPHPDPDEKGDFQLTPADERRLQRIPRAQRKAAENACFHHLKGLNLRPLSPRAIARANEVVADLGRCLRAKGHTVGRPNVRNLGRGRASFGFELLPYQRDKEYWKTPAGRVEARELSRDGRACEKAVDMAKRLTKIIDEDRRRDDL